jgi:hypothetical protein
MDSKQSPDYAYHVPQPMTVVTQLPPIRERVTEKKSNGSKLLGLVCTVGILGCVFLLFNLYVDTAVHHAIMDHNLQKLEAEVHSVLKTHMVQMNNASAHNTTAPVVSSNRVEHIGHGHHRFDPHKTHKNALQDRKWGSRSSRHHDAVAPVKRGGGATFTWFQPGAGACGGHQTENDYIIAISHLIFDGGSHCGDTVTITYKGKTLQATVKDECMGCDANHIDMSPKLLHDLAGPGVDEVTDGEWSFGSAPAPPPEEPKPKPSPTTHYTPPSPPPTTTTTQHHTTSTSSPSSSARTSTSMSSTSSSSTSSAVPSATPVLDDGQVHNFQDISALISNIGGIALSAVLVQA